MQKTFPIIPPERPVIPEPPAVNPNSPEVLPIPSPPIIEPNDPPEPDPDEE